MQPLTPEPQGAGLGAPPFLGVFSPREPLRHHRIHISAALKRAQRDADTQDMIISDEQARAAAQYLKNPPCSAGTCAVGVVPGEVLAAAHAAAYASPDTRPERVVEAVERMRTQTLDSRDIAEKMLSRILSDALR